jgi:hypothetical protein
MKNFSELTDIKSTLTIKVKFTVTPVGILPCLIKLNSKILYEDNITQAQTFDIELPLTDPIDLTVQIYRHHPDAVVLNLSIDEHEILPKYQHLANPPTDYVDFNEIWTLNIPNFYPWYHEITGQGWIA